MVGDATYRRPFNRPDRRVTSKLEQLTVSLNSLSGRKERKLHSQVHISACLRSSGARVRPGFLTARQRGVY